MTNSRRMRWEGHVRAWEQRNAYRVLVGKLERKKPPGHRWENSIKMDLRQTGWGSMDWIHLAQDRDQWCFCDHSNELSGSIKCWKIVEQLSNWWLLKGSVSWS
jgi:hypothetical protein